MSETAREVRRLREQKSFRDPRTGLEVHKPAPPPMRTGVRGGWTYREDPPPPRHRDDADEERG